MTSKTNSNEPKPAPEELNAEDLDKAQGGLLPAVQKVRDAAARSTSTTNITDGTSNTIAGDGSV